MTDFPYPPWGPRPVADLLAFISRAARTHSGVPRACTMLVVRSAALDDVPVLASLHREDRARGPRRDRPGRRVTRRLYRRHLADPGTINLVASVCDGQGREYVLGFLTAFVSGLGSAGVTECVVRRSLRRRGIGTQLFEELRCRLEDRGIDTVELVAAADPGACAAFMGDLGWSRRDVDHEAAASGRSRWGLDPEGATLPPA